MHIRAQKTAVAIALSLTMVCVGADDNAPVVTIDDTEISREQFELQAYNEARQTYYHGRPNSGSEILEFRKGFADKMIDRVLLLDEARRRGIAPDHESIAAKLAVYEDRYGDTERWQVEGEQMLARVRERLEEDSLLNALEEQVKAVEMPDDSELQAYYQANPDKFTEPEQIRVSTILLAVPSSSTAEVWEAARRAGAELVSRITAGESFEDLARMHSAEPSGKNGGDMGYMHAGMLSENAQQAIDKLEVGEMSDPVTVLEGIAIFRLTARKEASLQTFATVQQRAIGLWQRDEGERMWSQTIAELRSRSSITIDDAYLEVMPVSWR